MERVSGQSDEYKKKKKYCFVGQKGFKEFVNKRFS